MLSLRQQQILFAITQEHIGTASPVSSDKVSGGHGFRVSPATVRNEMAVLEKEGYLMRPHTSAGCIPTDKGYRHYVEFLPREGTPSLDEQRLILHLFHQVERRLDEWVRLASGVLAQRLHTAALATLPKAVEARFRHLELVVVRDAHALLILVLRETRLKQRLVSFEQAVTQEDMNVISPKLNAAFANLAWPQIEAKLPGLSPLERQIAQVVQAIMEEEDRQKYDELYVEGLRQMLNQPEFAYGERRAGVLEFWEERSTLRGMLPDWLTERGVRVIIGEENKEKSMRYCAVVVAQYGVPGEISGAIGVVGPTRIPYGRAISMVDYLASIMSELAGELYRG